jgi:hypothetical protein
MFTKKLFKIKLFRDCSPYEDKAIIEYNKRHKDILSKTDNYNDIRLRRAYVNYIRHCRTNYDVIYKKMKDDEIHTLKNYKRLLCQCLDKIAMVYPELAYECEIQKSLKGV